MSYYGKPAEQNVYTVPPDPVSEEFQNLTGMSKINKDYF